MQCEAIGCGSIVGSNRSVSLLTQLLLSVSSLFRSSLFMHARCVYMYVLWVYRPATRQEMSLFICVHVGVYLVKQVLRSKHRIRLLDYELVRLHHNTLNHLIGF